MSQPPRYDGLAQWYDAEIARLPITLVALSTLVNLLGRGTGRCLDLGCGTGIALAELTKLGWSLTGVDVSDDQLRTARDRLGSTSIDLVNADASSLPFPDESFEAVVSLFTHTDFDQPAQVFREVARVLRPGGRFIYVGTHPCYVTPFVERTVSPHLLHPGYRRSGWTKSGPGFGTGIRPRVGVNHYTLSTFVQMIIDAPLQLKKVQEPGDDDYPLLISLVAER